MVVGKARTERFRCNKRPAGFPVSFSDPPSLTLALSGLIHRPSKHWSNLCQEMIFRIQIYHLNLNFRLQYYLRGTIARACGEIFHKYFGSSERKQNLEHVLGLLLRFPESLTRGTAMVSATHGKEPLDDPPRWYTLLYCQRVAQSVRSMTAK